MDTRIPVIIDCDPGVDDSHALLMALASPKLDVRAITTTSGNMPVELTTINALKILELAQANVPVSRGSYEPIYKKCIDHSEMFHGKNGLGNVELAEPKLKATDKISVTAMYEEIEKAEEKLHIIALGPLTNIALLLKLYPTVKEKIAHLTIMGGGQHGGNITKYAEYNFFCDAEAADAVMQSGLPMTLIDLNGCNNCILLEEDVKNITSIPSRVSEVVTGFWKFNLKLSDKIGDTGFVIHDSIAVASVIDSTIIKTSRCNVTVETKDLERYGQSIVTKDESGTIEIAEWTDRDKFLSMCEELMRSYPI